MKSRSKTSNAISASAPSSTTAAQNWPSILQELTQISEAPSLNADFEATIDPFSQISGHFYVLDNLALISIEGPDASTFLQGQLTADVEAIDAGGSVLAAHCNAKGRMHSNFMLHKASASHYFLQLKCNLAATAKEALAKYAVFSKVELRILDQELFGFGQDIGSTNSFPTRLEEMADVIITSGAGKVCWLNAKNTNAFLSSIKKEMVDTDKVRLWRPAKFWDLKHIRAVVAYIDATTSQEFIPQMLNMDCLGGISFSKGCYTGQEVIARMKYRGKVKRRCFSFSMPAANAEAGNTIVNASGKPVGSVVNAVQFDSNTNESPRSEGLAVMLLPLNTEEELYLEANFQTGLAELTINPAVYDLD